MPSENSVAFKTKMQGHIRAHKADSGQGKPVRLGLQGRNIRDSSGNACVILHVRL